jgi:hypothetical protein
MFQDKGLVNLDASHYAGSAFTSTVDPRSVNPNVLSVPASNIQSANASRFVGGGKKFINRKKINKISRMYKMRGSRKQRSRKVRRMKSRVRSRYSKRSRSANSRSANSRRRQRGGYAQGYEQTYSTGGHLSPSLSALANPAPFQIHGNNVNNYNHFTRQ